MEVTEHGLKPMEGEKVLKALKPHYLAFYDMYLVWVWLIFLSLAFMAYGEQLGGFIDSPALYAADLAYEKTIPSDNWLMQSIPFYDEVFSGLNDRVGRANRYVRDYTQVGVWALTVVLSATLIAAARIEWKWPFIMAAVCAVSVCLSAYFGLPVDGAYYFAAGFSIVGIAFIEVYRGAHTFYVTDRRLVTEVRFTYHKRNELSYEKINNIILEQDFIGRVFGFGTIIPVTASGLGMGSDFSAVTVGAAGNAGQGPALSGHVTGGKSVQTPRSKSMYALFGVGDPQNIYRIIAGQVHEQTSTPYLRRMSQQLERLRASPDVEMMGKKLDDLMAELDGVKKMLEMARQKYHQREIDEESFKRIIEEHQRKLIELEYRIRNLEDGK
jgi:hypothetical protein